MEKMLQFIEVSSNVLNYLCNLKNLLVVNKLRKIFIV